MKIYFVIKFFVVVLFLCSSNFIRCIKINKIENKKFTFIFKDF